ncbi:hypothetical protein SUGI_0295880 [Cryptomeria japonica]|nr:hypothetical protein SUGI_0295880 [Cryptomeria japonica]
MDGLPNSHAFAAENASEVLNGRLKLDQASQTLRNCDTLTNRLPRFSDDKCVLCQGFSIREYVSKVRSMSIRESWPLPESLVEGNQHLLPPLNRPIYRWWACQYCHEGHKHCGTRSHTVLFHGAKPENNGSKIDVIIDREIMFSIEPFSNLDMCSFGDLEEQIRKQNPIQNSGQDDNTGKNEKGIIRIANNDGKQDVYERCQNSVMSPISANPGFNNWTLECASQSDPVRPRKNGKPDANVHRANQNGNGQNLGTTSLKASINRRQLPKLSFDLMERECRIFKKLENSEKTEKAKRAKKVARFQITAKPMSIQSDKNKIKNQRPQGTRSETLDINNGDHATGVKVCPVCTTFTSATVTTVNAHIDDCLAQTSDTQKKPGQAHKRRSRTQKKRSIIDICAASPRVQNHSERGQLNHIQLLKMGKLEIDKWEENAGGSLVGHPVFHAREELRGASTEEKSITAYTPAIKL